MNKITETFIEAIIQIALILHRVPIDQIHVRVAIVHILI